jgi:hypothetical protein
LGLEALAGMKLRPPAGMGSKIAARKRKWWATIIQVLGPEGAGVTSYILQLVQPGILDEVMPHYNSGKTFTTLVQYNGIIRKVQLRDNLVDGDEKRFKSYCLDYMERKPTGVVWIAPGRPDLLKDDDRPEYELFRRYVQFLTSDTYPVGGKEVKKKKPKFLIVLVNHMDEYDRMWSVNFFDFLHHYRGPLAYIRKNHKDIRVNTQPCCAWANVGVREPLMDVLMDLEVEKSA